MFIPNLYHDAKKEAHMSLVKYNDKTGKYYPYLIKNIGDGYYFYNITTNAVFLMDDQAYNILVKDHNPEEEVYADTIQFFKDNFILVTPENDIKLEKMYSQAVKKKKFLNATALTLMISQECNLRCKYCYGKDGEYSNKGKMDFSIAKKAINYFVDQAPSDILSICFFGGEPLLNFGLMKEVVAYVREIEKRINKKFSFSMTTNATLIGEEVRAFIEENKIGITVSIDGTREMNDANRFYANKNGTYAAIKNNIADIKTNMIARATIAPPNLDVQKSITHLVEEFGFKSVAWAEADNLLCDEDYKMIKKSTLALIDKLEGLIKDGQYEQVKKYHSFMNMIKKFDSDGIRSKGCGAGSNMMAVDIDGKIYPCHRFVGIEPFIVGDVMEGKKGNMDFYSVIDLVNFEKCQSCIAKSICGGGCINENYCSTESINEPSENHCKFKVEIVNRMLEIYIRLDEAAKQQLFGKK
jgi:uncharacterized protein